MKNSLKQIKDPFIVISGGSNLLIDDKYFNGNIIKIDIKGITKTDHKEYTVLEIGAGEVLDKVINYSVNLNLSGIEAMSKNTRINWCNTNPKCWCLWTRYLTSPY